MIGTISKAYGADTVTTTTKVEQALKNIKLTLPAGVALETEVFRQANFIESAIHNLSRALLEGAISGFSVDVRMGQVETVAFSEDKEIGLTVYVGQQKAMKSFALLPSLIIYFIASKTKVDL